MELEQALHELEILRAEELRASQGRESPLTEALAVAISHMAPGDNDPIRAFVADRCQVGAGRTVEVGELYREWCGWCAANGRHPGTSAILGRNLHAAVPGLAVRQRRKDGAVRRVYEGIGVKYDNGLPEGAPA